LPSCAWQAPDHTSQLDAFYQACVVKGRAIRALRRLHQQVIAQGLGDDHPGKLNRNDPWLGGNLSGIFPSSAGNKASIAISNNAI
jgi:hypothetical protein